jgi:hypothetical protein
MIMLGLKEDELSGVEWRNEREREREVSHGFPELRFSTLTAVTLSL